MNYESNIEKINNYSNIFRMVFRVFYAFNIGYWGSLIVYSLNVDYSPSIVLLIHNIDCIRWGYIFAFVDMAFFIILYILINSILKSIIKKYEKELSKEDDVYILLDLDDKKEDKTGCQDD